MLTRLYVDNFRCFVNFEYRPGKKQLVLGENGSGKTSLMEAMLLIRQFVVLGDQADSQFPAWSKTRWLSQARQTFELEADLGDGPYIYRLVVEWRGDPERPCVAEETLTFSSKPIFEFVAGEVHLYNDRFERKVEYPFDWHRSALATVVARKENQKLVRFKVWLAGLLCFKINPFVMAARSETEQAAPTSQLDNFSSWYRHLVQALPKENTLFLEDLRGALSAFQFLQVELVGENLRVLTAEFNHGSEKTVKLLFNELSDGQRCLICLYAILHFVVSRGGTVIIDEPDNFITLREIQPWLVSLTEAIESGRGQAIVISHHPELINQWAPEHGTFLVREEGGPVRAKPFRGHSDSPLTPAEMIARGWQHE